jgi:hypothetical protein
MPIATPFTDERLQELELLVRDPGDRRTYVKTCVEEFPRLVRELIRLRE